MRRGREAITAVNPGARGFVRKVTAAAGARAVPLRCATDMRPEKRTMITLTALVATLTLSHAVFRILNLRRKSQ